MELLRGKVYLADLDNGEQKPWIVVSNNGRNRALGNALVVRVTTTNKYTELSTVVQLPAGECVTGWIRCDSLTTMYDDEPAKVLPGLSRPAMAMIEDGLRAALGMA